MARVRAFFFRLVTTSGAIVLVSCLPTDTRPAPGSVDVTVTADEALLGGHRSLTTVDGWTVSYDRFLIALNSSLTGETTCAGYYTDGYGRILDMAIPGPQKLNVLFALGHCDFGFRVESADPDPYQPVGKGVTLAEKGRMATGGLDPYTNDGENGPRPTGIAVFAKGRATKDAVTKTFAWEFRQKAAYRNCAIPGKSKAGLDLVGNQATSVDIRIHGEALFFDSMDPASRQPRFDPFAAADDRGDGDGDVTLEELGQVRLGDIGLAGLYRQRSTAGSITPNVTVWTTLEDFVYLGLYPALARFEEAGACAAGQEE